MGTFLVKAVKVQMGPDKKSFPVYLEWHAMSKPATHEFTVFRVVLLLSLKKFGSIRMIMM